MRYRLTVAYVGTAFGGWQRQPNAPSVQAALEAALERLAGTPVATVAAGRTDAGVHADGQVVHLDLARPLPAEALIFGVNRFLPETVRVLAASAALSGFHARWSATAKRYRYRLSRARVTPPRHLPFVWPLGRPLDLEAMRAATEALVGRHDFSAFALAGGAHRQSERRLFAAAWHEAGDEVALTVVGDGFLRGMVRGLAGTLVEIGLGRRAPETMAELLRGAPRRAAGPTAPAQGLSLIEVYYPAALGGPARDEAGRSAPEL